MATYKVPQDVEADDKLIGPFSFRQFIYLIIVALAGVLAWGLAQLFIGLAIVPIPIIIFFGALALPLRKDQPMEIYMAAIVSFYIKPRQRLWDPEGIESLIEISAPKTVDVQLTKDLSQTEAEQRLSYLANIVDSQGWAIRGVNGAASTVMNNDIYLEAQSAEDVLDTNTAVAHTFDQMMSATTERMHEEARQRMFQPVAPETVAQAIVQPVVQPVNQQFPSAAVPAASLVNPQVNPVYTQTPGASPHFDPYPTFHQSVIQPLGDTAHRAPVQEGVEMNNTSVKTPPPTPVEEKPAITSDSVPTADIISLANNTDYSIETIAHEANRLKKKAKEESEEVVISLR